jgi:flagellar protein FlaF
MHQQGAKAYHQTAKVVETPRDREAALLMKAASGLQRMREDWPADIGELNHALTYNRKLWTIFMSSATRQDHHMPAAMRENIVNLGIFILNETREMMMQPTATKLDALININRQLAAGLRGN